MTMVNDEKLMKILLGLRLTEKAALLGAERQYVFKVLSSATKPEIKRAVELLFKVKVDGVQVSNVKTKARRFGQILGKRKGWKKAYVKLADGHKIDIVHA